jgi:hypothetical protein
MEQPEAAAETGRRLRVESKEKEKRKRKKAE